MCVRHSNKVTIANDSDTGIVAIFVYCAAAVRKRQRASVECLNYRYKCAGICVLALKLTRVVITATNATATATAATTATAGLCKHERWLKRCRIGAVVIVVTFVVFVVAPTSSLFTATVYLCLHKNNMSNGSDYFCGRLVVTCTCVFLCIFKEERLSEFIRVKCFLYVLNVAAQLYEAQFFFFPPIYFYFPASVL